MALLIHERQYTPAEQTITVGLLSGFEVATENRELQFPLIGSRLIAYLALQQRPVSRAMIAGILWPETTQEKAQASLRSALWRVRRVSDRLIRSSHDCLALTDSVVVDVVVSLERLRELNSDAVPGPPQTMPVSWFCCELLPDWYDDWVVFERERFRLAALHTLDKVSALCRLRGDFGSATEYALLAIRLEPLRESSRRALIESHLDQGNLVEALWQYNQYRQLLDSELDIAPTGLMTELLEAAGLGDAIASSR